MQKFVIKQPLPVEKPDLAPPPPPKVVAKPAPKPQVEKPTPKPEQPKPAPKPMPKPVPAAKPVTPKEPPIVKPVQAIPAPAPQVKPRIEPLEPIAAPQPQAATDDRPLSAPPPSLKERAAPVAHPPREEKPSPAAIKPEIVKEAPPKPVARESDIMDAAEMDRLFAEESATPPAEMVATPAVKLSAKEPGETPTDNKPLTEMAAPSAQNSEKASDIKEESTGLFGGIGKTFRNLLSNKKTVNPQPDGTHHSQSNSAAPVIANNATATGTPHAQQDDLPAALPTPPTAAPASPQAAGKPLPSMGLLEKDGNAVANDFGTTASKNLPSMQSLDKETDGKDFTADLFDRKQPAPVDPKTLVDRNKAVPVGAVKGSPLPEIPAKIADIDLDDPLPISDSYEVVEKDNKPLPSADKPKEMELALLPDNSKAAPKPSPQAAPLKPSTVLQIVYGTDNSDIPSDIQAKLNKLASDAKRDSRRIIVTSYASGKPDESKAANMMSLSRSLKLRAFLIEKGIPQEKIIVQSKGLDNPSGPADRADLVLE